MTTIFIAFVLALLGLFLGSFVGAMVWRLRAAQLKEDEAAGEKVSKAAKKEVHAIKSAPVTKDRSVCLHCGHQLSWYDLVPLVSWTLLKGKCRYCHKRIGNLEPILELSLSAFFVLSYLLWPVPLTDSFEIVRLALWLIASVGLAILTVYDAKWYLLPNKLVYPLIGLGLVNAAVVWAGHNFSSEQLLSTLYACLILSGLYYLIYVASNHRWVGFGDVKLGLVLALMLADWRLAILALFLANVIGTLIIFPLMLSGRVKRGAHIPFGPLLIAGYAIAGLVGTQILTWYLSLTLGVS